MLSAQEAYEKTLKTIEDSLTKQLQEIEICIEEAIENGEFIISKEGYLKEETKNALVTEGYIVTSGTQYNEPYYIISWR